MTPGKYSYIIYSNTRTIAIRGLRSLLKHQSHSHRSFRFPFIRVHFSKMHQAIFVADRRISSTESLRCKCSVLPSLPSLYRFFCSHPNFWSNPVPLADLYFDSFSYLVACIVFGDMAYYFCLERYRLARFFVLPAGVKVFDHTGTLANQASEPIMVNYVNDI